MGRPDHPTPGASRRTDSDRSGHRRGADVRTVQRQLGRRDAEDGCRCPLGPGGRIPVQDGPTTAIALEAGSLWVVNPRLHTVWAFRTSDHAFLHSVTLRGRPSAIDAGPSGIW